MKVTAEISRIDWDTDGEVIEDLPTETTIEVEVDDYDELDDEVTDALSDKYGFCLNGFAARYFDEDGNFIDAFSDDFGDYVNSVEARVS